MSNIFRTWQDRIASGTFTKSYCQQFTSCIARMALGYAPHGRNTALTYDQAEELARALRRLGGVGLTPDHTEQGLTWLRNNARRVFGDDFPIDRVTDDFSHFTYQGEILIYGIYNNGTLPEWHIHLKDGSEIVYHNAAWQGGDRTANGWRWVTQVVDGETIDMSDKDYYDQAQARSEVNPALAR